MQETYHISIPLHWSHLITLDFDLDFEFDFDLDLYFQAFPLLRLFKDSEPQPPDYKNDRTLDALMDFMKRRMASDEQLAQMHPVAQGEGYSYYVIQFVG